VPSTDDRTRISWRVHLRAAPAVVYGLISTASGRRTFWAESAEERDGVIEFRFPNGAAWRGRVLERIPPRRFGVEYLGGTTVVFECDDDGSGGTDVTLTEAGVVPADWSENHAGWVSVLLALKASADFGVDLRNHDAQRTWDASFVDN
jgi:uncharacterized protein YndB with AHSA1/START domain